MPVVTADTGIAWERGYPQNIHGCLAIPRQGGFLRTKHYLEFTVTSVDPRLDHGLAARIPRFDPSITRSMFAPLIS